MNGFCPELLHRPQTAVFQPLSHGQIGSLGVHVNQTAAFFHGNEVVFGFPGRVLGKLTVNPDTGDQQFPAPAGIFYMHYLNLSLDFHMSDKPIGTGQKRSRVHIGIFHEHSPLTALGYQKFPGKQPKNFRKLVLTFR